MLVKRIPTSRFWKFTAGLVVLSWSFGSAEARAQAPYLIPYTISTIAGSGSTTTTVVANGACAGSTLTAEDVYGNGCVASSPSVTTTANIHDVGVDQIGGVYIIDIGTNTVLRKIDPHSGIINVLAGTPSLTTVCSSATDKYGDGCPANDGKGNAGGAYTSLGGTSRGIAVAKNGDVYIADYTNSLIHKVSATTGLMSLVAGYVATPGPKNGSAKGYTGDGGLATNAELNSPRGVAVDAAGNIYIADSGNNVVRMVSASTGFISTIVGKYPSNPGVTTNSFAGDSGPANAAAVLLNTPEDVEVDAAGNLFIADEGNARVRVVYAGGAAVAKLISLTNGGATAQAGYIYTIVGAASGTGTYTAGSMMLSTSLAIGGIRKIALDPHGNLYIADNGNNVVWFVDATTGYMRVIAGTFGTASGTVPCAATNVVTDNVHSTLTTLFANNNMGVGVGPQGDVYVSDSANCRLRKVSINTTFPAVASGSSATQTLLVHFAVGDTQATASPFTFTGSPDFAVSGTPVCTTNADNTTDCAVSVVFTPARPGPDAGTLVVKSKAGLTTQLALSGTGTASSVALDPGNTALLTSPVSAPGGIAQDGAGNTYIADTGNNRVVEYTVGGTSSVIAGTGTSGYSGDGAAATAAKIAAPKAVAVTPDGAVYIADTGNNVIRRVDPVSGFISTFAGGASTVCASNVAFDSFGDGCPATQTKFSAPAGIVSDPIGNLYVSDTGNNIIRQISTTGYVYLTAGASTPVCSTATDVYGNGCAPISSLIAFKSPTALALDSKGNLYIADTGNNEVRKITVATNLISLFAGTGQSGGSGNGGAANTAQVNGPTGLALDAANNLYIADTGNHVVRVVAASGTINTVVGTLGSSGTGTVPGSASGVLLNLPGAVVASGIGKLYVLDSGNNRLFSLDRGAVSLNFGRTNDGSTSPTTAIQQTSTGSYTATLGYPLFSTTGSTAVFSLAASGTSGCSSSSSTPQTLAPGAVCNLSAQFIPTAVGPVSATYTESNGVILTSPIPATPVINSPAPAITLSGTGALLTKTTLTTAVTTPAAGTPQYSISFVVTATLHPAVCDPTAPNCSAAGTITFFVDGTQVGLPVAVSNTSTTSSNVITASATINGQSVGNHAVIAVYSGDTYYASSTAPTLTVAVAQGATLTVATAIPASGAQFTNLSLTAQVSSSTSTIPTGSVAFYAGTTLLGSSGVNPLTGVASIQDAFTTDSKGNITNVPQSFGLIAGAYNLTAVYSGDSNYATSTSAGVPLTITADPQGFAIAKCMTYNVVNGCVPAVVGTAQGSTAQSQIYIIPSNTLNGTLSFACTGLPANSVCTFSATVSATQAAGSTLTFTPVAGPAVPGTTIPGASVVGGAIANPSPAVPPSFTVTLWTDVNPNVNSASSTPRSKSTLAGILGWPMLLGGFTVLLGFRKRLRNSRLLAGLALFALLTGSATVLTGCTSALGTSGQTPVGSYTVTLTVTGPNGLVQTTPITFTVGAGLAGQL